MSGVATAIGGAAIVGAIASDRASDKAADASKSASRTASAETRRAADEARGDINRIFPQAQDTARKGFQSALDVFGQSLPAQTQAFTQGNVGAQQAILSGLPQIQNALLGGNVDLSQIQAYQPQMPDLGFFSQQLPENPVLTERLQEIEAEKTAPAAAQPALQEAKNAAAIKAAEARVYRATGVYNKASNKNDGRFGPRRDFEQAKRSLEAAKLALNNLRR